MTIIVMGHIRTGAGEIERLRDVLSKQVTATRAEHGCDHYSFSADIDDPDMLHISERWASPEALASHSASTHMKEFNKAIGGADVKEVVVKAWNGEFWRNLIGG